nr:hypothetical protein [Actinomadura flavalba]
MREIFEGMLRHARELLAVRGALDAELIVSDILGSWWGGRLSGGRDAEEIFGEGLVAHAARAGTPAALALLTGVGRLGTNRQAALADDAARVLVARGVARPGWAGRVGQAVAEECFVARDRYGDHETVVCTFAYNGIERHALIAQLDRTRGGDVHGVLRDAWVSSRVARLLEQGRKDARENPLMAFEPLDPRVARARLTQALDATDAATVGAKFGAHHAFLRTRLRALPPGGAAPRPAPHGRDARATLAARFLASAEAESLSDVSAASRCADQIIQYGCDHDFGRPLRVSPSKVERFLLDWLPRKVLLTPAEQEAVPHVLAAWTRWAAARTGLPAEGVRATLDAVWDATGAFASAYRDPASSGLDPDVLARLLPDRDLEALPRRAFALPFLVGKHRVTGRRGVIDLAALDPADPVDRRVMLEFEHPGADPAHLDAHERLAAALWDGEPPELWDAAQALLDAGVERHDVLHRLITETERHVGDAAGLRGALRALRHEPPRG